MMLAVQITNAENKPRMIDRLKQQGAIEIEMAKGEWRMGERVDLVVSEILCVKGRVKNH